MPILGIVQNSIYNNFAINRLYFIISLNNLLKSLTIDMGKRIVYIVTLVCTLLCFSGMAKAQGCAALGKL